MSFKETPFYTHADPDLTLVVGEDQIQVHEYVLSAQSGFVKAVLRSEMKEAYSRRIKLPEIQPAVMTEVLNWLYRASLTSPLDTGTTAFSEASTNRLKEVLHAFDFLQIKGPGGDYSRFIEGELQKLGSSSYNEGESFHINYTKNVVAILNEVYKAGGSVSKEAMSRLAGVLTSNDNRLIKFKDAVQGLTDPDGACFRDISLALAATHAPS